MSPALQPVTLEVFAHIPTDLFHCSHCERLFDAAGVSAPVHQEVQTAYPPEMLEEAAHLATWLEDLATRYGELLHIQVLDPQSPQGFFKSLRYRISRYPTFVISRRTRYTGWNPAVLDRLLQKHVVQIIPDDQNRGSQMSTWEAIWSKLRHLARGVGEILYGMTTFDWARDMRRERGEIERLFMLITFGDLIGLPILPPYYTLRLLPYIVPTINRWKRSLLRERDWTDLTGLIEGID